MLTVQRREFKNKKPKTLTQHTRMPLLNPKTIYLQLNIGAKHMPNNTTKFDTILHIKSTEFEITYRGYALNI